MPTVPKFQLGNIFATVSIAIEFGHIVSYRRIISRLVFDKSLVRSLTLSALPKLLTFSDKKVIR